MIIDYNIRTQNPMWASDTKQSCPDMCHFKAKVMSPNKALSGWPLTTNLDF